VFKQDIFQEIRFVQTPIQETIVLQFNFTDPQRNLKKHGSGYDSTSSSFSYYRLSTAFKT
jgi:hypothetical protein